MTILLFLQGVITLQDHTLQVIIPCKCHFTGIGVAAGWAGEANVGPTFSKIAGQLTNYYKINTFSSYLAFVPQYHVCLYAVS